jgi:metal-responsive CopG/Arc/MetJ family transcriptional regulator
MQEARGMTTATRAHIILPEDLLADIDRVAGKRKRSRFVESAIREKLSREMLASALRESAGAIDVAVYPEWSTPEDVSAWVATTRRDDSARLSSKLRTRLH